jgi:sugar lactone lactonase YvrE
MNTTRVLFALSLFALIPSALACSGGGVTTDGGPDAGGDAAPPCTATGMGSLTVTVTGLPMAAAMPMPVTITGGGSSKTIGATQTLMLPAGNYDIKADKVVTPDPIVRTVYTGTVSATTVCVGGMPQTVTVAYAQVPTSNKIWLSTSNSPDSTNTQGYASAMLAATGMATATIGVKSAAGRHLAFDKDGNLWANGGTVGDPQLVRFPAASFAASGSIMADRKINIAGLDCLPGVTSLALDKNGALWVGSSCKMNLYRIDPMQQTSTTDVTPALTIPFAMGAEGLAFDKNGNLWVATGQDAHLARFDAASLTSATAMPSTVISAQTKAVGGSPLHPGWLAFDASGNLWSNDFGGNIVYQYTAAALGGSGMQMYVPPALVTIGVAALLGGMAFDEGGGLWITASQGKFARLTPAQLTVTTDPGMPTMPDRVISGTTLGYGEDIVLYPAATGTPLVSANP